MRGKTVRNYTVSGITRIAPNSKKYISLTYLMKSSTYRNFEKVMQSKSTKCILYILMKGVFSTAGNTLQCPSILSIPISTSHGRTINLDDFVLNGNASFSPSQTVTLNVFTLNTPLKVKISALHEDGTRNTCTFLIYTKGKQYLSK